MNNTNWTFNLLLKQYKHSPKSKRELILNQQFIVNALDYRIITRFGKGISEEWKRLELKNITSLGQLIQ